MLSVESAGVVFLLLLVFVVAFALLARKLKTPYPIILVIAGLALSLIPGTPRFELNPDLVFYVVLPPLVYAAAWFTSWREFRHNLISIVSLAIGLVSFTIAGVAVAGQWLLPDFDWRSGVILGAVIAPTDATAAAAIASRIGLPQRVVDLLEDESLVNDATALVALGFGMSLVLTGATPTLASMAMRFAYLVAVGLAAGAVVAVAVTQIERWIDDGPIEISISILVPYAAYICADAIGASGILAVVTSGLILSRRSPELFSPPVRLQLYAVWSAVVFILNGLVFVLIGLQLPGVVSHLSDRSSVQLLGHAALFTALVTVLRLVWVFPAARVSYFIRRNFLHQTEEYPTWRDLLVFAWSGMRGVVSLAAALALPASLPDGTLFPQRHLIVFVTFSVVVATLVAQGLTLTPLTRMLGLAGGAGPACEQREAYRLSIEAALAHLEDARGHDRTEYGGVYDDLAQHYRERLAATSEEMTRQSDDRSRQYHKHRSLAHELLRVQRRTLLQLRRQGRIDDRVLRNLEHDLDLQESRDS
jgi:CPA1 family monovalent cation:H+ antiporter